ncbi:MAG: protein-tyrosine phosphatase, partial [Clostridiales bacterium]|nr:protein-tyrosine phosphatase [Clostridiales bacterium]
YEQGVRSIIATPHFISGSTKDTIVERRRLVEQVKEVAKEIAPDLAVFIGNELYYTGAVLEDLQKGRASTLADSDYVLVEFSTTTPYKEIYQGFRQLIQAGYRPVLAHVERYEALYKKEDNIRELISLGIYIQMNTESVMGGLFDGRAAYCRKLMASGLIHLLGSDAHSDTKRPPLMLDAVTLLRKKNIPEALLEKILYVNPERILQNKYI